MKFPSPLNPLHSAFIGDLINAIGNKKTARTIGPLRQTSFFIFKTIHDTKNTQIF